MSRTKPRDHVGVRKCKCNERLIVSRIVWLGSLGTECLAFVHGRDVATPNDLKLSDGGAWRGSCEGGAKKEATDVGQRWLGGKTPKPESAATVTRGAVRCSAWLDDFGCM